MSVRDDVKRYRIVFVQRFFPQAVVQQVITIVFSALSDVRIGVINRRNEVRKERKLTN